MSWSIRYVELFSVAIEQSYYQNNFCAKYVHQPVLDFDIVPSMETMDLMRRFDFIFRRVDSKGGFVVLSRTNGTVGPNLSLQFKPGAGRVLTFFVVLQNPLLVNQNDLPELRPDELFYFSNRVIDPAAPRDDLHLTLDASGVKGEDILNKTSGMYSYQKPSPIAPGSIKVRHLHTGREILPKTFITQDGKTSVTFDLSNLNSGRWRLLEGGATVKEFYFTGAGVPKQMLAAIELSLDSTVNPNYRIVEADGSLTPQRPLFKVRMPSRETVWRYTVVLQPTSPLLLEMEGLSASDKADFINRLNVVTNDPAVTFARNVISDTRFEFVSDTPLQLQERYYSTSGSGADLLNLSLKKYIGDVREASVRPSLPYPSNGVIDASSASVSYSDVLLTL